MNVLFIAYHPVSYPIMLSQGLPYMRGLSKKGVCYSLLTFETAKAKACSQKYVFEFGMPIRWRYLVYHNRPRILATIFDVILGGLNIGGILIKDRIEVIHARGFISGLMAFIPAKIFKAKFFFDTRGLLADKYVCGGLLDKKKLSYRVMRYLEDFLLKYSESFTVESKSHAEVIKNARMVLSSKVNIIPCCVDTSKFDYRLYKNSPSEGLRLIYLGQVGTWYLLEKMLDLFKALLQEFPYSQFTFISESEPGIFYSAAKKAGISLDKIIVRQAESSDIPNLLAAASIGIFFMNPYKQYSFFPIKFGEYLASGLPVVVNSGIGDCDEIIRKERIGAIIEDFSLSGYKNAINVLKLLLSEGDPLRKRCRAAAEEYCSLVKGVESYWSIYRDLADSIK